ncbi:alkane 1-monooxygenase [Natronospira bacteriovora]|uniref:Alkane 1-monooxygenase n=1 Tax=Natronospira bacteriovora TaxID=3069753 RepID=A0ABU0W3Q5_9GAMM|nr:alkane 1-monooxygenase [Natronospira sp. AB-CW4]MDQ2068413.1 alkane 1-monooxygenase [Natronospira sp. AB-CW4]
MATKDPLFHARIIRPGFLLPFILPLLLWLGVTWGGFWAFLPVVVVFGLIPLADLLVGRDRANVDERVLQKVLDSRFYSLILYLWVPVQFAVLVWAVWRAGQAMDGIALAGLMVSTGVITGGIGITVAHELGHRRGLFEKTLARLLLISVAYLHFLVEHNRGHHSRVATPDDPATARFGESFYRFLPRTLLGSWRSAWDLEVERMQKEGCGFWSLRNQMIWAIAGPLFLLMAAYGLAGSVGAATFAVQAVIAFTLLEVVNYIEHYGLERRRTGTGRYEKVRIHHSWNASERLTNFILFNLQRHSHHHAHSITPYQALQHFDESPQLPTGYAGMVLLALVPSLWRRVMDPRAKRYRQDVLGIEGQDA